MKLKKLLALLLCFTLVTGMVTAFATTDSPEDTQTIAVKLTVSKWGHLIEEVTLADVVLDGKEIYTLDDVFLKAHNLYYEGGETGYSSMVGDYGAYITRFWGDESGKFGYQINGGSKYVGGLDTTVENGDYIDVAIYENAYPDTEVYTKFDTFTKEVIVGEETELTLLAAGYDENWNMVFSPCEGVIVSADGKEYVTDAEGKVRLTFEKEGTYTVTAYKSKTVAEKNVAAITAPVCKVSVSEPDYLKVMHNIAEKYSTETILTDPNMEWFVSDMTVYNDVYSQKGKMLSEDIRRKCIDKAIENAVSSSKPNVLAKSILTLRALGCDAKKVYDKSLAQRDIVSKLCTLVDEKNEDVTNVYTLPYVLLALCQGENYATEAQINYLIEEIVNSKESWQNSEWGPDGAASILLALAPFYNKNETVKGIVDETVYIIKELQSETGAIGNAASTGLVITAFSAYGIDSFQVSNNGKTLIDGLLSFCTENFDGFAPMTNSFSTEQGFRGLLAYSLMKNKGETMYNFISQPMNEVHATWEPAGCPVIFEVMPKGAEITVSGAEPADRGKYDLAEGKYTYSVSAAGYSSSSGTIIITSQDAENHIEKNIRVQLQTPSIYGGGGGGRPVEDNTTTKEEAKEEVKEEVKEEIKEEEKQKEDTVLKEITFTDVHKDNWYYDSVRFVCGKNLMQGTGKDFEPDSTMTRAMLVTVLYRMEESAEYSGENTFADVREDSWYFDAVKWASGNNIVSGVETNLFAPDENITREQMAVILYRYAKLKGFEIKSDVNLEKFEDADNISDWAFDALKWANASGIINGISKTCISPSDSATRAQVATMIMRFCGSYEK